MGSGVSVAMGLFGGVVGMVIGHVLNLYLMFQSPLRYLVVVLFTIADRSSAVDIEKRKPKEQHGKIKFQVIKISQISLIIRYRYLDLIVISLFILYLYITNP